MANDQVDSNIVLCTSWDHDVGVLLCRSTILIIGWFDKPEYSCEALKLSSDCLPSVLLDNIFNRSSPFGGISFDSSSKPGVCIAIDEQFHIAEFSNLFVMK